MSLASGGMVVSCWITVSNGPTWESPLPAITPNSVAWPRSVLTIWVRWPTKVSRTFKTMP